MKKRILSLILALCALAVLATVLSVTVFADDTWTYTSSGNNVTYTAARDTATRLVTLTVSGTGYISYDDVQTVMNSYPWSSTQLNGYEWRLIIEDGVTQVNDSAFVDQRNLISVMIKGNTLLVESAFYQCQNLREIIFEKDVCPCTTLDITNGCSALKSIYIFGSADEIYGGFFDYGSGLNIYSYTDNKAKIESCGYGFVPLNGTCGATANDNVTWRLSADGTMTISGTGKMADYDVEIFNGTINSDNRPWKDLISQIKKVVITDGVTGVGEAAFASCTNLASIELSNSVASIGKAAFLECSGLTNVEFPGSVSVHSHAFRFCTSLKSVVFCGDASVDANAFNMSNVLSEVYFFGKESTIDTYAFRDNTVKFYGYTDNMSLKTYCDNNNEYTFIYLNGTCYTGNNVVLWSLAPDGTLTISGTGAMADYNSADKQPWKDIRSLIKKVVIKDGVTRVGNYAFANCENLTSVDIPDSVSSIGTNAFATSGLTSVTFPTDVMIGADAFNNCKKLTEVVFYGDATVATKITSENVRFYGYTDSNVRLALLSAGYSSSDFAPLDGTYGGVTWKLTPDGVLTIYNSGNGSCDVSNNLQWQTFVATGKLKSIVAYCDIFNISNLFGTTRIYTIHFINEDSKTYAYVVATDNKNVPEVADPVKPGYIFAGWYYGETKYDFTAAVTNDLTLTAKWKKPDYANELEQARKTLEAAVQDLKNAVDSNKTDIDAKIKKVNSKITDLQEALTEKASQDGLDSLKTSVTDISSNISTIQNTLAELNTADANLQRQIDEISQNLNNLQTGLTTLKNRITALETSVKNLQAAQATLETALANKAGKDELQTAITNLNTAIAKLNTLESNLAATDAALTKRIDDLIGDATGTLKDAEDRLKALEADMNEAKADIDKLTKDLAQAQKDLNDAIDKKADAATLTAAVEELQKAIDALEAVKDDYKGADEELEKSLTAAIEIAKDAAIKAANDALETAKSELNQAIGKKADATALADAITNLNTAIATAQQAAQEYADGKDETLNQAITDAENTLKGLISDVQTNLDKAVTDLNKAISDGDKDLSDKITALNTALENAKTAFEKADADNKTELNQAITDAENTLKGLIDDVQKNLDKAVTDLNKAISDGDKDLADKITALNTALETAKTALEKADADNKTDLNQAISDAQTALQAAIDKIASDLEAVKSELEAKDAELEAKNSELEAKNSDQDAKDAELEAQNAEQQTFITVVCVIACVSLAGNVAIVTTAFVLKRKRTH